MASKIMSIFIDESGDFGPYQSHAPYYIVSMILHNQGTDITENIKHLNEHIVNLNYNNHAIHVGPLIRRESTYISDSLECRKKLFSALFNFARKLPFSYICVKIKKSECNNVINLTAKLSKSIANALQNNINLFKQFENIIVYYDNGQVELTKILTSVFNVLFSHVDFRKVSPIDYKLFQVADLICSLELLSEKAAPNSFSKSEKDFFGSIREFHKNYYKVISKKRI